MEITVCCLRQSLIIFLKRVHIYVYIKIRYNFVLTRDKNISYIIRKLIEYDINLSSFIISTHCLFRFFLKIEKLYLDTIVQWRIKIFELCNTRNQGKKTIRTQTNSFFSYTNDSNNLSTIPKFPKIINLHKSHPQPPYHDYNGSRHGASNVSRCASNTLCAGASLTRASIIPPIYHTLARPFIVSKWDSRRERVSVQ